MEQKGLFAKIFGVKKKPVFPDSTQVRVKHVGDIPPMVEARRLIGNEDTRSAIITLYSAAKKDYSRYFKVELNDNEPNRQFLIRSFMTFGINIPEEGNLDNTFIQDYMNDPPSINENMVNQFSALRKLATFYLEFYEKVRFSSGFKGDPELILEKASDIYNYMDVPKLYYPEAYK